MKRKIDTILVCLYSIILLLFVVEIVLYVCPGHTVHTPKIGEVWLYPVNKNDPFKKYDTEVSRVINIKGDYIQYIINDKDTASSTISTFIYNSKKIK